MDPTVRVLVVDDDPELAELTALYLQRCDETLEPVVETSVAAGLERLDEVDCVVSDYEMPGANGLDFLASVRRIDPDLPFVLFTGKGSEEIASRAISAGVTDYLRKGTGAERYEMLANRLRNAVEHRRTERELERAETRYRRFVEQDLFGCYIIQDGVIEFANEQLATVFGYERDEIVGERVDLLVHEDDRERVRSHLDRRTDGDLDSVQYGFRARRKDGSSVDVEVHGGRIDYGGEPAVLGVLVEAGERERHVRSLDALTRGTQRLMRAGTREAVCEAAVDAAREALDLDATGVYLRDGDRLEPVAVSDEAVELFGEPPTLPLEGSIAGAVYRSKESRLVDDFGADEDSFNPGTTVRSGLYLPIDDHGVIVAGSSDPAELDEGDRSLAAVLAANVEAALDRTVRETQLNELHAATRRLMTARSRQTVAEIAVDTARDVLGHELNGIHLLSEDGETLPQTAMSEKGREVIGEVPPVSVDDSAAGEVFRSGEIRTYSDVQAAGVAANPDTPMRRELVVPLGDEGVFIAGGTEPGEFSEAAVSLARVFAANVETALARASREEAIRARETELRRQNERLEEFAGVVSHDLRNPLEIARGYTELAREVNDSEALAAVDRAHDRLAERIDELLVLARGGAHVDETERVAVGDAARRTWSRLEEQWDADRSTGATLDVDGGTPTIDADPERLTLLLENLLGNAVQHGGPDVTVRVGPLDGGGFYVADDGPGIPDDAREDVFAYGHTTDADGNGFGLAVVRTVADAHGWEVRATEGDDGGARFEISVRPDSSADN